MLCKDFKKSGSYVGTEKKHGFPVRYHEIKRNLS